MFCQNCGNQLNDGARFCPGCGAPTGGAAPSQPQMNAQPPQFDTPPMMQSQPGAQQTAGYALPDGIELTDDGTFFWTYEHNLWKNPTILYTILKVMLIAVGVTFLIIAGISLSEGSLDLEFMLTLGVGLTVGLVVLTLLGYAVFAMISGGKHDMLFFMDEERVVHTVMPKVADRGKRINEAAIIIGALSGNLTLTGMGMANYGRTTTDSPFADVKSIVQDRAHDLIKVRSGFDFNQIYASPAQYDFVLSHIASHCPSVRVE